MAEMDRHRSARRLGLGALAAGAAAAVATLCCLPIAAGLAGLGALALAATSLLGILQPWLAAGSLALLTLAFWVAYRPAARRTASGEACATRPSRHHLLLWTIAVAALALATFPWWSSRAILWLY